MKDYSLEIISTKLITAYLEQVPGSMEQSFDSLKDAEISTDTFSFYTSVSSVFSS